MIITDIKQLREIPVGGTAVLVIHFKVVKANEEDLNPCRFCVFDGSVCSTCCVDDRPDKKSVKFIKV